MTLCQIINWYCSVHLKQSRGQEARNKSHLRQCNRDSFFEHDTQVCPPSISDMGQLRLGSKSYLMECLTKSSQPASIHLGIDAKALDGAAIVHNGQAWSLSTFEEYSHEMILPYITSQLETVSRVVYCSRRSRIFLRRRPLSCEVPSRRDSVGG